MAKRRRFTSEFKAELGFSAHGFFHSRDQSVVDQSVLGHLSDAQTTRSGIVPQRPPRNYSFSNDEFFDNKGIKTLNVVIYSR